VNCPKISVIVPVYNNEKTLGPCLEALERIDYPNFEIIVVDDASIDASAQITRRHRCRVIRNNLNRGVTYSRNKGAAAASGDIIAFVDSDVVVKPSGLVMASREINRNGTGAVAGLFTEKIPFNNFCSQYKNIWVRVSHLIDRQHPVVLFGSGCLIEKALFDQIGGFDENYHRPDVEDTEIGSRIYTVGSKIILKPEFALEHQKHYNLRSLLKTDYERSRGLTRMMLRAFPKRGEHKTCITIGTVLSVPLTYLALILSIVSIIKGGWIPGGAATAVFGIALILNRRFVKHLWRYCRGPKFFAGLLLFFVDMLVAGCGIVAGLVGFTFGRHY
jgi:glycosyltransferase involved in cell wall biosynthesis